MFKKKTNIVMIFISIILTIVVFIAGTFIIKGNAAPDVENDLSYLDNISAFEIESKYCNLYFPEEYKDDIKVKYSEKNGYKVKFYANVEGREPVHAFDICFNSDDGDLLGYIENMEENEIINLSVDVMELEFDDSWTEEEMNQVYAVQEERNFVVDSLSKIENYVIPEVE